MDCEIDDYNDDYDVRHELEELDYGDDYLHSFLYYIILKINEKLRSEEDVYDDESGYQSAESDFEDDF